MNIRIYIKYIYSEVKENVLIYFFILLIFFITIFMIYFLDIIFYHLKDYYNKKINMTSFIININKKDKEDLILLLKKNNINLKFEPICNYIETLDLIYIDKNNKTNVDMIEYILVPIENNPALKNSLFLKEKLSPILYEIDNTPLEIFESNDFCIRKINDECGVIVTLSFLKRYNYIKGYDLKLKTYIKEIKYNNKNYNLIEERNIYKNKKKKIYYILVNLDNKVIEVPILAIIKENNLLNEDIIIPLSFYKILNKLIESEDDNELEILPIYGYSIYIDTSKKEFSKKRILFNKYKTKRKIYPIFWKKNKTYKDSYIILIKEYYMRCYIDYHSLKNKNLIKLLKDKLIKINFITLEKNRRKKILIKRLIRRKKFKKLKKYLKDKNYLFYIDITLKDLDQIYNNERIYLFNNSLYITQDEIYRIFINKQKINKEVLKKIKNKLNLKNIYFEMSKEGKKAKKIYKKLKKEYESLEMKYKKLGKEKDFNFKVSYSYYIIRENMEEIERCTKILKNKEYINSIYIEVNHVLKILFNYIKNIIKKKYSFKEIKLKDNLLKEIEEDSDYFIIFNKDSLTKVKNKLNKMKKNKSEFIENFEKPEREYKKIKEIKNTLKIVEKILKYPLVIISILIIGLLLSSIIETKIKELGVLKAIGYSSNSIIFIYFIEIFILGIISLILNLIVSKFILTNLFNLIFLKDYDYYLLNNNINFINKDSLLFITTILIIIIILVILYISWKIKKEPRELIQI